MNTFLVRGSLLALLCFALTGCITVPPESVVVQKKVVAGIDTARANQHALIAALTVEKKERLRISYEAALPNVLKKMYPNQESYSAAETEAAIKEYHTSLNADYAKIDNAAAGLTKQTDQFFDQFKEIADLNRAFLESSVKAEQAYKAAFDSLKVGDKSFSTYLTDKLNLEK